MVYKRPEMMMRFLKPYASSHLIYNTDIMETMDIDPVALPIMQLPVELLLHITNYLPPHSAMLFALTCKKHFQLPGEKVWAQLGPKRHDRRQSFANLNARRYVFMHLYRDLSKTHRLFTRRGAIHFGEGLGDRESLEDSATCKRHDTFGGQLDAGPSQPQIISLSYPRRVRIDISCHRGFG
ncbi:hypothetical protein QBC36DRAFT_381649 [Triangularia setosa]|uniref:F-box domain-containing protein n=1 Tax=Triangularia setosa TaxID=2587417 RepID=A0AAN6W1M8_9PEZI|nr:hypothetical protein QBC36DRAFT_381649 [Podospora setosa]